MNRNDNDINEKYNLLIAYIREKHKEEIDTALKILDEAISEVEAELPVASSR